MGVKVFVPGFFPLEAAHDQLCASSQYLLSGSSLLWVMGPSPPTCPFELLVVTTLLSQARGSCTVHSSSWIPVSCSKLKKHY